jgi:hypothetical protein
VSKSTEAGLRGWLRLFPLGNEPHGSVQKMKSKRKNSWNNPRGLRSTAHEFLFFVCSNGSDYLLLYRSLRELGNGWDGFIYKPTKIGTLSNCFCRMIDRLLYSTLMVLFLNPLK